MIRSSGAPSDDAAFARRARAVAALPPDERAVAVAALVDEAEPMPDTGVLDAVARWLADGLIDEAVALCAAAARRAPHLVPNLGRKLAAHARGGPADAEALDSALEADTDAPRALAAWRHMIEAQIELERGNIVASMAALGRSVAREVEMAPQFGQHLYDHLVGLSEPLEALDGLMARLDQLPDDPKGDRPRLDPRFHLTLGRWLLERGANSQAIDQFAIAAELDPHLAPHFGQTLFDALHAEQLSVAEMVEVVAKLGGNPATLVPDLRKALVVRLADDPDTGASIARLLRGESHARLIAIGNEALGSGKPDYALAAYGEAMKLKPQDVLTRLQMGVTAYLANRHHDAERHFAILRSLQEAERARYGVSDKAGAVLHNSWLMAIGHIASLDTFVKAMRLGWLEQRRPLLAFDPASPPAGLNLLTRWSRYIDIVGVQGDPGPTLDRMLFGEEASPLDAHQRDLRRVAMMEFFWALPDQDGAVRYYGAIGSAVQRAWKAKGLAPLLSVSDAERKRFRVTMRQAFGLPDDAWFVLLHVREGGFNPEWEASHGYTRNGKVADYDLCVERITEAGGWVIRGGDPSMTPLAPRPHVIDYATSALRSPELDILLCAECRFFLGTNSGFSLVPPLFGKRCVLTNWTPLANPNWNPDDIFIPKLVVERATGRLLGFEEMFASKAAWSPFTRDFLTDWAIVDNSPSELLEAVDEMMAELEGVGERSEADEARQAMFAAIAARHGSYPGSRIGTHFLRAKAALLGEE